MFSNSTRHHAATAGVYLGLVFVVAVFVFPLVWMLSYSLRPVALPPPTRLEFFTTPLAFENYPALNKYMALGQLTLNSLQVVILAVPLTLLTASWAGFAIAQLSRRWRTALLTACIALLLVPSVATWIPRFILFTQLHLIDTVLAMIAPGIMGTSPLFVILFYLSFQRVPREVYESAYLDGAHALRIWWSVAMPLARPATNAVAILTAAYYWSNYIDPLLYLRSQENFTLPVGVQLMTQAQGSNFPLLMAIAVVLTVPVIVLFLFVQPYFLQGRIAERWFK
jgi:ABC-type glycerol-3-phosphate transport system permease component